MAETDNGAPPRALLVVAAVLAVLFAGGVAYFGLKGTSAEPEGDTGPLPLVSVPAPQAGSADCAKLVGGLPADLTSNGKKLSRRELAEPAPAATVAWGTEAVVLRCGLDKPSELTQTAQLRTINGVQWLPIEADGVSTWYLVDRSVYAALTVPKSAGTGPLQSVSDAVAATLPPQPLRF
ncbi:DUF3515 domain-containing protein [Amycolatopsis sp. NPDC059657]|uniref:DUF3515 domain-containing protein n=1 Tax=Amycolatopsis sp. NPDC059657 TaxID=3346899 RepID=UPI003670313F